MIRSLKLSLPRIPGNILNTFFIKKKLILCLKNLQRKGMQDVLYLLTSLNVCSNISYLNANIRIYSL
jgi:hypothetical protein